MLRAVSLLLCAISASAAHAAVDMEAAAAVYGDAAIREQVRASLGAMPDHIRRLFSSDASAKLTAAQLEAVGAAAKQGFRIDVFEVPALSALAAHLDSATARSAAAFLESDVGRRMVAADVAESRLDESKIDQIMSGEISVPTTKRRAALFEQLERASHSTESTVQIFISMGQAVAIGTAVGAGRDSAAAAQGAQKFAETSRAALESTMREPLRRYMAYGYRDLSDADLRNALKFLGSAAGQRYIDAYIASLGAGFDAMGRRCGEQIGESIRELAQAEFALPTPAAPAMAAPAPGSSPEK